MFLGSEAKRTWYDMKWLQYIYGVMSTLTETYYNQTTIINCLSIIMLCKMV